MSCKTGKYGAARRVAARCDKPRSGASDSEHRGAGADLVQDRDRNRSSARVGRARQGPRRWQPRTGPALTPARRSLQPRGLPTWERMNATSRKLWLTAHVISSVGWLGAVGASLSLGVVGVAASSRLTSRSSYIALEV